MSTDDELRQALVEVVKAARGARDEMGHFPATDRAFRLTRAIDALDALLAEAPNRPTGFVFMRHWHELRAGWFVRTPKGEWHEIIQHSYTPNTMHTHVSVLIDGKPRTLDMPHPGNKVAAKKGTKSTPDEAVRAIMDAFPGTVVLEDWS